MYMYMYSCLHVQSNFDCEFAVPDGSIYGRELRKRDNDGADIIIHNTGRYSDVINGRGLWHRSRN